MSEDESPSKKIVSSAMGLDGQSHDEVAVWNRGGLAGRLVVTKGDGNRLAKLIAGAEDMHVALMAVRLHLMVRPQNRLAIADANVAEIVSAAIEAVT